MSSRMGRATGKVGSVSRLRQLNEELSGSLEESGSLPSFRTWEGSAWWEDSMKRSRGPQKTGKARQFQVVLRTGGASVVERSQ